MEHIRRLTAEGRTTAEKLVAVALEYAMGRDAAPKVSASGRGAVAERIVEEAEAHGVPVQRDSDLAQVLAALDIGDFIPVEVFSAVAEILGYLYRVNGRLPSGDGNAAGDAETSR